MMPFLFACYSTPTSLYDAILSSACGVQQGDPLGLMLFSLAVRRAVEEVAGLEDLDASVWFLDIPEFLPGFLPGYRILQIM